MSLISAGLKLEFAAGEPAGGLRGEINKNFRELNQIKKTTIKMKVKFAAGEPAGGLGLARIFKSSFSCMEYFSMFPLQLVAKQIKIKLEA